MKILFTGGNGRFGSVFKKKTKLKNIQYPSKKVFNILNPKMMLNYLKKNKPDLVIHAAGLSRPMSLHDENINLSIDTNIIGTCNLVKICKRIPSKVNLIEYNSIGYERFISADQIWIDNYVNSLHENNIQV